MRTIHFRSLCIGALALLTYAGTAVAQTRPVVPPAPATASRLRDLVDVLDRDNPELKASRREIDMAVARIRPAGAPPEPMLSAGYMSGVLRPPFFPSSATPGAFRQLGLSQEIPYPGKLKLQTAVATSEVDVTRWAYEDRRVQLAAELKAMYLEYRLADRSLAIVRRNKAVLEQMQRIAEARFAVGQGLQQDVLKAQLEVSMLIEQMTMLERERVAMQARVNAMLYREPGTPVDPDLTIERLPLPGDLPALRAASLDFLDKAARALEILRGEMPECCKRHVVPVLRDRRPNAHGTEPIRAVRGG